MAFLCLLFLNVTGNAKEFVLSEK